MIYTPYQILPGLSNKRYEINWQVARVGDMRGVCRVLVGKSEGRKPLGRPTSGWEDNTKMDIQEVE